MDRICWFLTAWLTIVVTKSDPDLTLLLTKNSFGPSFTAFCVLSGNDMDSAITWYEPLSAEVAGVNKYVSEFVPSRKDPYNCDFDVNDCTLRWNAGTTWLLQNSLDHMLGPVTDYRWEGFNVIRTSFADNGYIDFKKLANVVRHKEFKVHISVRAEEGHIYLCDHEHAYRGNCYWITLNATTAVLRQCAEGKVPFEEEKTTVETCQKFISVNNTSILNKDEWRHITIQRDSNNILVWQMGSTHPLLNYTDDGFNIRPMIIKASSSKSSGHWKLHDYSYLATSKVQKTRMSSDLYPYKRDFCMSIFVAMCPKCTMKFELSYQNDTKDEPKLITDKLIKPQQGFHWQEEKLMARIPFLFSQVSLTISTFCDDCKDQFWALDKFEICSANEIRVLRILNDIEHTTCQLVKYSNKKVVDTNAPVDAAPGNGCPYSSFGRSCTNCSTVFGTKRAFCEGSTICEMKSNGKSICRCSSGYTEASCNSECQRGYYGFGCREKCGHCLNGSCNHINGACNAHMCQAGFTGDQCKKSVLPVLLERPQVVEVKSTSCKIKLHTSYVGAEAPVSFRLQYKEASQNDWIDTSVRPFDKKEVMEIISLKASTTYVIRAILITKDNKESINYDKEVRVTTKCELIRLEDIDTESCNTTITLKFKNDSATCKAEDYRLMLGSYSSIFPFTALTFHVDKLKPYTTYNISVTNRNSDKALQLNVTTKEGAPAKVRGLKVISNSPTSITVTWEPPSISNGNIRYYRIKYKHQHYLGCEKSISVKNEASRKSFSVLNTTHTLNDLIPYSEYYVEVLAATVIEGESSYIVVATKSTESPDEAECPTISSIRSDNTTASIFLHEPNCTLLKGPLKYYLNLQCSNSWCSTKSLVVGYVSYQKSILISDLLPYSNYTVKLEVLRLNGGFFDGSAISAVFHTKPSIPNALELTVYSSNETSLSFRVIPPNPTRGELSVYLVTFCYNASNTENALNSCGVRSFRPKKCKIWEKYHCLVLYELQSFQQYDISVQAKNVGTDFNQPVKIKAETRQKVPDAPTNLSASWDSYHNLTLKWDHPSVTNGDLTEFRVEIRTGIIFCWKNVSTVDENNYQMTYNYVIPFDGFCYSSNLDIFVSAFNIYPGQAIGLSNVFSPPKLPSFREPPLIKAVNTSMVTISLPELKDMDKMGFIFIVISSDASESAVDEAVQAILSSSKLHSNTLWIATEVAFNETFIPQQGEFVIGDSSALQSVRFHDELRNEELQPATDYTIALVVLNTFQGIDRYERYILTTRTSGTNPWNYAYFALLLLLLPVIVYLIFRWKRSSQNHDIQCPNKRLARVLSNSKRRPDVIPLITTLSNRNRLHTPVLVEEQPDKQASRTLNSRNVCANYSCAVKLESFEKYVKDALWTNEDGELERQFKLFVKGQVKPAEYGVKLENIMKNRNELIVPYDYNRVQLKKSRGSEFSDYINASYIEDGENPKAYIATQLPKQNTVNDFWKMVWQENVTTIVLIDNSSADEQQSFQYWPDLNQSCEYGQFTVYHGKMKRFGTYTFRQLQLLTTREQRSVTQLHFTSWPQDGAPIYPQNLVPLLKKISFASNSSAPLVIQTNAGAGRAGTVILCDMVTKMARQKCELDFLSTLQLLREQRPNMIANVKQYKLAHLLVHEILFSQDTTIPCDDYFSEIAQRFVNSKNRLAEQIDYVQSVHWVDQVMLSLTSESKPTSAKGCAFSVISHTPVDGYKCPEKYIVIQQPMNHLWSEFWKMVVDNDIKTIVSVNDIQAESQYFLWPTVVNTQMKLAKSITVKCVEKQQHATQDVSTLLLTYVNSQENASYERTVHLINMKGWVYNTVTQKTAKGLVATWGEMDKLTKTQDRVLVTCKDGVTASGVFVALSFLIDMMIAEKQCDVCFAMRMVRRNFPKSLKHQENIQLLYRVACQYAKDFMVYTEIE